MAWDEAGRDYDCEPAPAASHPPGITLPGAKADDDDIFAAGVSDSRLALAYLLSRASDDYIAVMDVLEASVTDMTPAEVVAALAAGGHSMGEAAVVKRLDRLRAWTAVSARTDHGRILRYSDIAARNWRYTPTPLGRQVQRFYRSYLSGQPVVREIPLTNLARLVDALEQLAGLAGERLDGAAAALVGQVFTAHDALDGALVGVSVAVAGQVAGSGLEQRGQVAGDDSPLCPINQRTRVAKAEKMRVLGLDGLLRRWGTQRLFLIWARFLRSRLEPGSLVPAQLE